MSNSLGFSPNWASPPGETIRSILFQRDVDIEEFSSLVGIELDFCERMLAGYESITKELAKDIELVTEVSASFWINRENKYREPTLEFIKKCFPVYIEKNDFFNRK